MLFGHGYSSKNAATRMIAHCSKRSTSRPDFETQDWAMLSTLGLPRHPNPASTSEGVSWPARILRSPSAIVARTKLAKHSKQDSPKTPSKTVRATLAGCVERCCHTMPEKTTKNWQKERPPGPHLERLTQPAACGASRGPRRPLGAPQPSLSGLEQAN